MNSNHCVQNQLLLGFRKFPNVSLEVLLQVCKKIIRVNYQMAEQQIDHLVEDGLLISTLRSNRLMPTYRLSKQGVDLLLPVPMESLTKCETKQLETLNAAELSQVAMQQKIIDYLRLHSDVYICTLELSDTLLIPFPYITSLLAKLVQTKEICCTYECFWTLN